MPDAVFMTRSPLPALLALCLAAAPSFAQDGSLSQERQWTLDASDQDAYLIFGVQQSDDVGISIWCAVRQGVVNIYVPEALDAVKPDTPAQMTIIAGDQEASFPGRAQINEDAGLASVEAKVPADNSVLEAMLTADRFRIKVGSEETIFPLYEADVAGLLALCRKG